MHFHFGVYAVLLIKRLITHTINYAQRWPSPDNIDYECKKSISQKRFADVAVMTEIQELGFRVEEQENINENMRISNVMFCKLLSHDLQQYSGNKRLIMMQKIIKL